MTPRAFHLYLVELAVQAGADPVLAPERMAQAAAVVAVGGVCESGCLCPDCDPEQAEPECREERPLFGHGPEVPL